MNRIAVKCDVMLIGLRKAGERYSIAYPSSELGRAACLRQLGKWATNKELSFTWYDAAVLANKVRGMI